MNARMTLVAAAGLALLLLAAPASAQQLAAGLWTGTVDPPDGMALDVEYDVAYDEEGTLQITLYPPDGVGAPPEIVFQDVALEEGSLTFWWFAGTNLTCELLQLEDGSFEGDCVDEDGVSGTLVMVPPE